MANPLGRNCDEQPATSVSLCTHKDRVIRSALNAPQLCWISPRRYVWFLRRANFPIQSKPAFSESGSPLPARYGTGPALRWKAVLHLHFELFADSVCTAETAEKAACRETVTVGVAELLFAENVHRIVAYSFTISTSRTSQVVWSKIMESRLMTLFAGIVIGAMALQGIHAQGAKPKAYTIAESETLDKAAQAAFIPRARKAIEAAHGRALRTVAGSVVRIEGDAAPRSVAIVEWDSVDDAVAFYKSKAWTDLAPERDKGTKTLRRYAVEVEK